LLSAPFALAFILLAAPIVATRTQAQMGPMMGQPLDQLSGDAFDQAFLMQMSMHHAMAVMMARPTVANGAHQELKDFASKIIDDQTREITEMRTWAKDWYGMEIPDHLAMMDGMQPAPHNMPMGGGSADHGAMQKPQGMPKPGGMPMGGMHDMSMMADLWKLPPQRLEVVFLSMMIPHHQGATDMSLLAVDRAAHQELKDLARMIIDSQAGEIGQMSAWLAARYGL